MEQGSKKGKIKTFLVLFYVLISIIVIAFLIFKVKTLNEKLDRMSSRSSKVTVSKSKDDLTLPSPDRIIYKNSNNEYVILDSDSRNYNDIYYDLDDQVLNTTEGKTYSEDEINEMLERGRFIEFDYYSKSKNYIFLFDETDVAVIKRTETGGQVIKTSFLDKNELIEEIEDVSKNLTKYDFNEFYSFTSENQLSDITSEMNLDKVAQDGTYKRVINSNEKIYEEILEKLNFKTSDKIPDVDFDKQSVVIIASTYKIQDVKKNVGSMKFELGEFIGLYEVNLYIVSKVVNVDCIYFSFDDSYEKPSSHVENDDADGLDFYVEDGKYYSNIDNVKTQIISIDEAAKIAEEEAKKDKYQYQGWESEFLAKAYEGEEISAILFRPKDEKSMRLNYHYWSQEWKIEDIENRVLWEIRLSDKNDALTSLYIYIDAVSGVVVGARSIK